jgi:N-methylhydantoinase B/oxoprolinase/acetone carboxylase alpha subunit
MTNTRMTDPEILEMRYPIVVEEFSIRDGSGGKGKFHGGDGTRRVLRFRRTWNARSCRRTASTRRRGSTAAATANAARPKSAGSTGRWKS